MDKYVLFYICCIYSYLALLYEMGSSCVPQAVLKFTIFLPCPVEYRNNTGVFYLVLFLINSIFCLFVSRDTEAMLPCGSQSDFLAPAVLCLALTAVEGATVIPPCTYSSFLLFSLLLLLVLIAYFSRSHPISSLRIFVMLKSSC